MAKAKSKRQLLRDERRKKKREHELVDDDDRAAKRQRRGEENGDAGGDGELFFEDDGGDPQVAGGGHGGSRAGAPEMEFFGMLTEEEQEYFRRADELLELNAFGGDSGNNNSSSSADEERRLFLASVFREARGKELKLASSQSCSRLMERLIQVASRRQLRHLFAAFAEHYATLVTHRFASHCCEQLFLQAAKWVGRDDEADVDAEADGDEADGADNNDAAATATTTMADLYLLVLDELEPHLTALLTDRFASHTLRVLLVVLSGRPQDAPATRSLLRSKNKETVRVGAHGPPQAAATPADALTPQQQAAAAARACPPGFTHAVRKIIADVAAALDGPALRVLATHPTGNPVLQLLVELELADAKARRDAKKKTHDDDADDAAAAAGPSLLDRLLPGAPASLLDAASPAADLLRSLVYDRIGSRLLETLIVHSPAKLFKALHAGLFAAPEVDGNGDDDKAATSATSASATPMAVFLRNDIACYPAMRVLERLGRDDLTRVVQRQILAGPDPAAPAPSGVRRAAVPLVTQLVQRRRFHVLRTLLERCAARAVDAAVVQALVRAIEAAAGARRDQGGDPARLVTVLCWSPAEGEGDEAAANNTDPAAAAAATTPEAAAPVDDRFPPVRPPAVTAPAAAAANKKPAAPSDPPADIHGCHLLAAMLALPGAPATAVETALRALDGDQLAHLATGSPAGARVLVAALASAHEAAAETTTTSSKGDKGDKKTSHPARRPYGSGPPAVPLPKQLVARLVPHVLALAASPAGHTVLVAIVQTPSRAAAGAGAGAASLALPFHLKDAIIVQLAAHEDTLRESWPGRAVWRAWRGDLWRTRRSDWVHFAKAGEPEGLRVALAPVAHAPAPHAARPRPGKGASSKTGANAVAGKAADSAAEEDAAANGTDAAEEAPEPAALAEEEERARQERNAAINERRKREKLEKKARKAAKPRMTLRAIKEKRARKKLEKKEKKEKKETKSAKKGKRGDKYAREKQKRIAAAAAAA